ncbi:MAG: glycosyltransferase family 4 protein [Parvularculaceae bacterium]
MNSVAVAALLNAGALIASCAAAGLIALLVSRFLAAGNALPDAANDRSSHRGAAQRAGGAAIFVGWLAALGGLAIVGEAGLAPRLAALAALAFAFGLVDDWRGLAASWKFLGQTAVAAGFVVAFGGLASAPVPFVGDVALGALGPAVTVFWIVAFMNAYNFMDGLNGVAAGCGVVALGAFAVATTLFGAGGPTDATVAALTLGAALAGFGAVNVMSGRFFMGDGGSQFISFAIAGLAVLAASGAGGGRALTPLFLPTAFAPFLADVAFTLVHRLARGRNVVSAHREHVYQLLNRFGRSHAAVAGLYLALTALSCVVALAFAAAPPALHWLGPIGLAAAFTPAGLWAYGRATRLGLLAGAGEVAREGRLAGRRVAAAE